MAEKVYHMNISKVILNISIYFITIVPSYVILYERSQIGFWSILILENVITSYLFKQTDFFEAIGEEAKPKDMMLLSISIIISIGMFLWLCIKHSVIFWIIIVAEVICMLLTKFIKIIKLR